MKTENIDRISQALHLCKEGRCGLRVGRKIFFTKIFFENIVYGEFCGIFFRSISPRKYFARKISECVLRVAYGCCGVAGCELRVAGACYVCVLCRTGAPALPTICIPDADLIQVQIVAESGVPSYLSHLYILSIDELAELVSSPSKSAQNFLPKRRKEKRIPEQAALVFQLRLTKACAYMPLLMYFLMSKSEFNLWCCIGWW